MWIWSAYVCMCGCVWVWRVLVAIVRIGGDGGGGGGACLVRGCGQMYEVTITKGRTTWKVHRPEQSLKWLADRMKANKVKNTPKFKGLKKLKRKATPMDIQERERAVEIFLGQLVSAVGVASIALHTPLRSWLEVDEEGRHGKSKLVSGINARAVCVVKALQSYDARDDRELSFAANDIISIIDDSGTDWWKAKMGTRVGMVPAAYVELVARTGPGKVLSKSDQIGTTPGVPDGKSLISAVKAIADYSDPDPSMLSFSTGEIIAVTKQEDSGWWEGTGQSGRSGWFPSSYVESITAAPADRKISEAARLELELSGYYGPSKPTAPPPVASYGGGPAPAPSFGGGPPPAPSFGGGPTPPPMPAKAAAPPPAATSYYDTGADDSYNYGGGDEDYNYGGEDYGYTAGEPDSKALYDYAPTGPDQIALRAGELVIFDEDYGDGWSSGTNEAGEYGVFPTSYVDYL
ncbi:uncharacterized protein AMSG_03823 [Thecamonas trahens ATCC 50062]|uniref:SH3 domain-containing protein n=1 Tax=Thecamonas trahens ATCC 50062 TaxID=461836 RepID=A0A0L0D4Y1_THETB|nr:hypothetical protein AMSG_03823 [Thecamonas trahens ATCC 50062]KNC47389.1 hypothetical protein AMSG_03823 [Thecamonas trahens ATCC 50062]|eukprot:XP_013759727.1 hypothetical protein AMSG_03823 [Thecamonas trahens ATCC 50062]